MRVMLDRTGPSTKVSIANARVANASTVKLKNSASNDQKYAMGSLFTSSIRSSLSVLIQKPFTK